MREQIRSEVASIRPLDELETATIEDTLKWIDSGTELCRIRKPADPDRHLVSYSVVVDADYGSRMDDYLFDSSEFASIRWFHRDEIPFEKSDPHMARFLTKLYGD
jgi:hypothetical protein